jgi:hypothetical protein
MFSVCLCAFFYVCVQVEALRRADRPPKESYRMCKTKKNRSERRSSWRPTGAVVPRKKNNLSRHPLNNGHNDKYLKSVPKLNGTCYAVRALTY